MIPQTGFHVVVGTVHLNGFGGSGKIHHTLGQKHLGHRRECHQEDATKFMFGIVVYDLY